MDSDKKGAAVNFKKWQASAVKQIDTIFLCSIIAILAWLAVAAKFDPLRYTVMAGDDLRTFDELPRNGLACRMRRT